MNEQKRSITQNKKIPHTPAKKTVAERLELLLDENSFEEIDRHVTSPLIAKHIPGDGVVTGFGKVNGRQVALYAQDFSFKGGSLGKYHAKKICKIMDLAAKIGCPIIGIIDSGGARIDEGIHALAGYGEIFMRNTRYSGVIPQISVIVGPCAGGAVYSPALTDFIFTTKQISQLFITGPLVIKQVLHQDISKEDLGGTDVHAKKSGVVHFVSNTEEACFYNVKNLLSYLPQNYLESPPQSRHTEHEFIPATQDDIQKLVPQNAARGYDITRIIGSIVDAHSFLEVQRDFAQNIVVGFARVQNESVGIVANQPQICAGALDIDASCKAARFINTCNSFSIPLISLVDIPGFLPGVEQEHSGIIKHGAKLLHAYAHATIPKITIILRKAFGGAYIVMGSKQLGADFVYAWPSSQIAVLGPKAAVAILHRKKFLNIVNPNEKTSLANKLEQDYTTTYLNPTIASEYGYIDGIIEPQKTRAHIIKALDITRNKVEVLPKKKTTNIPL